MESWREMLLLRHLVERSELWKFGVLFVLMLFGALMEAVGMASIPLFFSLFTNPEQVLGSTRLDALLPGVAQMPSEALIKYASVALFLLILTKNVVLGFVLFVQARVISNQQARLAIRMFNAYQGAPYEWHLQRNTAQLLRNIHNDTAQVVKGLMMPILNLAMNLLLMIAIFSVLVFHDLGNSIVALGVIGLGLFMIVRAFQRSLRNNGKVLQHEYGLAISAIQQGFGAKVDAKIAQAESHFRSVHANSRRRSARAARIQMFLQQSTPYAVETLAVLGLLIIMGLLVGGTPDLETAIPSLALIGAAILRLRQVATKIASSINRMNGARAYLPSILADVIELAEFERASTGDVQSAPMGAFEKMRIEHVTYTYPGSVEHAVADISLEVERGEAIAFVGHTGCGKSTLVNIILGLLSPGIGNVLINERPVRDVLQGWYSKVGYIPQETYLLDDTIRANVAFGLRDEAEDDRQVWSSLKSARLDTFVKNLPEGLDSRIGERGVMLSGGQRQRLGIARALFKEPDVIIMDEGTSALDNQTEADVMAAISAMKSQHTLILIAHRLTTLEGCDRIYVLENGRLKGVRSYSEVMANTQETSSNIGLT